MLFHLDQTADSSGIEQIHLTQVSPQGDFGVISDNPIALPAWHRGCYYAAGQRYDIRDVTDGMFPDGSNRCQPLAFTNIRGLVRGGLFLLLELHTGEHMALLPLTGPRTAAWFEPRDGQFHLMAGTFGTAAYTGDVPLLAWARAADPYDACRRAWSLGMAHLGHPTRPRDAKAYPRIFRYLGWCSWEHFRHDINEANLLQALDDIAASDLPIRFVLIDDGHIDSDNYDSKPLEQHLRSFHPRPDKFPHGWGPVLARRRPDGVAWFGLWLNFNGYWPGIAAPNDLGPLNTHLAPVASGALQPGNNFLDSFAFYDAFIGATRAAGFDFVKVDNQAKNLGLLTGRPNGVACAAHNAQALETACARHNDGLLNCMAHGPVSIFNTRSSAVTRCSEDYLAGDEPRARRHIHNSYANIPWLGQTIWGDHDMFHSNDPFSGRLMAVEKALSGGPIYLSDPPREFVARFIKPLCLADGLVLRPLAPGAPLRRALYINPFADPVAYTVAAPLPGGAAAVVAYNLTEPVVPVTETFQPTDHAEASAMMADPAAWPAADQGLVLYDWEQEAAAPLTAPASFTITGFNHRFVLLCPLHQGWAAIGLIDKYLAPAGVEVLEATAKSLLLRTLEGGRVAVYHAGASVTCPGHTVQSKNDLHIVDLGNHHAPTLLRFELR